MAATGPGEATRVVGAEHPDGPTPRISRSREPLSDGLRYVTKPWQPCIRDHRSAEDSRTAEAFALLMVVNRLVRRRARRKEH